MRWLLLALLAAGCGSAPTAPSPTPRPVPTPAPSPAPAPTVTVTLTDTVTGATIGSSVQSVNAFPAQLSFLVPGYVQRQTWIRSATATVDLIPEAGFNLAFYRQFVRGGLTQPSLEPLRRLTQAPRFYVRTVDEAGGRIDSTVVSYVSSLIATSRIVEAFTGGQYSALAVESGPDSRENVPGWITIRWHSQDPTGIGCGRSPIAGNWIDLTYSPRCGGCPGASTHTFPMLVKHEIGHALGFWHTDNSQDLMYSAPQANDCDNNPSQRERYHAAIAYHRQPGNRDVDSDTVTVGLSAPRMVVD